MADELQRRSGYVTFNTRGGFAPYHDGMNNRANALAQGLGVLTATIPSIAEIEGQKAYQEGIKARLDNVERENANEANNGFFAPLFRGRAEDGFDYQDAMMDAPQFAMRELDELYSLRESMSVDGFAQWTQERDERFAESLEGKSDIYRTALAERMQGYRASQATTFAGWVNSNRDRARAQAAAASARAAADAAAARLTAATGGALSQFTNLGADADLNAEIGRLMAEGPEVFGIARDDMEAAVASALITSANENNNPAMLEALDVSQFSAQNRAALATAADKVAGDFRARENFRVSLEDRAQAEARQLEERQANEILSHTLARSAAEGMDPTEMFQRLTSLPHFQRNPMKLNEAMADIQDAVTFGTNPVAESRKVSFAGEAMLGEALAGGDPHAIAIEAMGSGLVRTPAARARLQKLAEGAKLAAEAYTADEIDDALGDIEQSFPATVTASGRSLIPMFGDNASNDPRLASDVSSRFRANLAEDLAEFVQAQNRMPTRRERMQLIAENRDEAIAWGQAFGDDYDPSAGRGTQTPSTQSAAQSASGQTSQNSLAILNQLAGQ